MRRTPSSFAMSPVGYSLIPLSSGISASPSVSDRAAGRVTTSSINRAAGQAPHIGEPDGWYQWLRPKPPIMAPFLTAPNTGRYSLLRVVHIQG